MMFPNAGYTELAQVVIAAAGYMWQRRMLGHATREAAVAQTELERMVVGEHLEDERVRAGIQLMLVAVGVCSVFVPPPPPDRFSQMMSLDPRGIAWTMQHATLVIMSIATAARSWRARYTRRLINEAALQGGGDAPPAN